MTVKELIEELKQFPQDAEVEAEDYRHERTAISFVSEDELNREATPIVVLS